MEKFKKFLRCLFALAVSAIILYGDLLYSFPSEINMYKNEIHSTSLGAGVFIGDLPDNICTWDGKNGVTPLEDGEYTVTLKFANALPFKRARLKISPTEKIYASGELIGLRLHNNGLIVTATETVKSSGVACSPARDSGIIPGDVILEINGIQPPSGDGVSALLTEKSTITVLRNNSIKKFTLSPQKDDSDGKLKMGIWVRDSTAGVGTLTFFNKENLTYGALGHAINDSDTGTMFDVRSGSIEHSNVLSITKGQAGVPGEISGSFSSQSSTYGTVRKNCEAGIFGLITSEAMPTGKEYPIGVMSQVKEGNASILSAVSGNIEEYKIKIMRSMPFGSATKGLMIEITDPDLLQKTGGIVQGM